MYKIPAQNVAQLCEEVAKLNKRAEKLGVEPVRLIPHGTVIERRKNAAKVEYDFVFHLYEIEGATPKLAGWTLVAAVERLGDENLVRCVPGQECPESFRFATTDCDHCKTNRRRREVFVLRHEDGHHVQVGRQCIKDFLGGKSPESIIAMAEFLWAFETRCNEAGNEFWGCGGSRYTPSIEEFLATVAICIRKLGWISAKVASEQTRESTANTAVRVCTETNKYIKELIDEKELFVEDRDVELATAALEWAKALPTTAGDYEYNLGVACRAGIVSYKTQGIIASAIASYQRHMDREVHIKGRETYKDEHVGILKARQGFKVTVKAMRSFDGMYGVKTLVRMKDEEGRVIVWWSSGDPDWLKEGDTVEITGTVKEHGEYNGKKQTTLSRVVAGLPKPKKAKAA